MRLAVFLFLLFFVCLCFAGHPKRYVVDLDLPASERWNKVVHDHLDAIPEFMKVAQSVVPKHLLPIAFFVAQQLNRFFPDEYAEEVRGIARASGLPLGFIVSMNILYDIAAFDRKHILQMGCTSIVAENDDGLILHGRNLDYGIGDLLKNITILVDFVRSQGQEKVLSSSKTYSEAVDILSSRHLFSPSYIIIGGRKKGEGAIISRDRWRAADLIKLDEDRWFLVETNFDHWRKDMDKRRITAVKMLKAAGRYGLNVDTMLKVLHTFPVKNNLTLFTTVMSARYPSLIKKTTFIWS